MPSEDSCTAKHGYAIGRFVKQSSVPVYLSSVTVFPLEVAIRVQWWYK